MDPISATIEAIAAAIAEMIQTLCAVCSATSKPNTAEGLMSAQKNNLK